MSKKHSRFIKYAKVKNTYIPPKKSNWFTKLQSALKKPWVIIATISTLFGLITGIDWLMSKFKTPHEIWHDNHFISGMHIPSIVPFDHDSLTLVTGGICYTLSIKQLRNGVPFNTNQAVNLYHENYLMFKLVGEQLYVSASFKDLNSQRPIGVMNFNIWEIRNEVSDFHDEQDNMELLDFDGNVVFNMKYSYPDTIRINGYFFLKKIPVVVVLNQDSFHSLDFTDPDHIFQLKQEVRNIPFLNSYSQEQEK